MLSSMNPIGYAKLTTKLFDARAPFRDELCRLELSDDGT